ncbi:hypothetical protein KU392_08235 [Advenella alkanexedens]|uniref:Transglycosylase SLT domain-containing protein n=1 Tax=Advenella alkanexedens TaxID=1481665 RepID=A0ABS6NPD4_9BURK|nr:hypothetical protein [Advenella alkanexedens]NLN67275.1 hypothetical protein [Alcaligenaceae bacterium]
MSKIGICASFLLLLSACSTTPPANPENICEIFREKPSWHEAALDAKEKWGVPVHVPMAMMYQESTFRHDAKPPKDYLLGIIPWGRVSSAYGYAQAKDEVWSDYRKETNRWSPDRDDFSDALDFMGWYMSKAQKVNGVSKWDAYAQYLNYHEGWTGYRNGTHQSKKWLLNTAQKVKDRASRYSAQYAACSGNL